MKDVIEWLGCPKEILSDNGLEFSNLNLVNEIKEYGIKFKNGAPYKPNSQGRIERFNQTLMNKVRKLSNFGKINWVSVLGKAVHAYNISFCRAIGMAPDELFGYEISTYDELKRSGYVKLSRSKQLKNETLATLLAEQYYKEYERLPERVKNLKLGEFVYYYQPELHTAKLDTKWGEKYKIVKVMFKSYELLTPEGKNIVANEKHVKPCNRLDEGRVLGF